MGEKYPIEENKTDHPKIAPILRSQEQRNIVEETKSKLQEVKKEVPTPKPKLRPVEKDLPKNKEKIPLQEQNFIVTAYYIPEPNQERYSYSKKLGRDRTYEEECKLQGSKKSASGQDVHYGMLAAPRCYDIGTRIDLEGFGECIVGDRGGSINRPNKLDICLGKGESGLEEVEEWGKRKIKGKIIV